VLLLRCGERWAIRQREKKGLLAGLWEFPNELGHPDEAALRARFPGALSVSPCGEAKHIFTHVEWHMRGLWIDCAAETPGLTWVTPEEIRSSYALPTAFGVYKEKLLRGERSG
jgi:A/G-specific adenine glycosylase